MWLTGKRGWSLSWLERIQSRVTWGIRRFLYAWMGHQGRGNDTFMDTSDTQGGISFIPADHASLLWYLATANSEVKLAQGRELTSFPVINCNVRFSL